jgi:hypothetical protein
MSGIAIFSSLIASTLSGIAAIGGVDYYACYYNPGGKISDTCNANQIYPKPGVKDTSQDDDSIFILETGDAWISLEWALVGISVAASVSTIVLIVLTAVPLCCSSQRHNSAIKNNQVIFFIFSQILKS